MRYKLQFKANNANYLLFIAEELEKVSRLSEKIDLLGKYYYHTEFDLLNDAAFKEALDAINKQLNMIGGGYLIPGVGTVDDSKNQPLMEFEYYYDGDFSECIFKVFPDTVKVYSWFKYRTKTITN